MRIKALLEAIFSRKSLMICGLLWSVPYGFGDGYVRQGGVDALHYEIAVELGEATESISGSTRVQLLVRQDGLARVWLDFAGMTVDSVLAGGVEAKYARADDRLTVELDPAPRRGEIVTIEVRYYGRPTGRGLLIGRNGLGRRVWFAENWPDRAHSWFPCIDHPSDKATADVLVTADQRYDVVAPGSFVETRSLLDGRRMTHWSEPAPIPTYCMVFGAAEFSVRSAGALSGIPISWYAYPPDATVAARRFERTRLALEFLAGRIGPFPYGKLAHVEATTRLGGMENAGAIFYAESSFRTGTSSEGLVPHETAHQWFGDSVTEADWDHLWLSEGFATYFEALFLAQLGGDDALKHFMSEAAEAVMAYHKDHPIPIVGPEPRDLMKKLNPLNYQKGAWVLHMLRKVVGDEAFFQGIRTYYNLYAGKSVLSEEFQRVMEAVSGKPLEGFFRQWLYQPGWPEYRVSWTWDEASGAVDITVRQIQPGSLFAMPVEIAIRFANRREMHTVHVSTAAHSLRIPAESAPSAVDFDPDGWVLKSSTVERR